MREKYISLIDLIYEILLRWRMLIVWMMIGGILLGAFSYIRSKGTAVSQAARLEEAKRQLEQQNTENPEIVQDRQEAIDTELIQRAAEQLSDVQLRNLDNVIAYEKLYLERLAYKERSVLLQLDAYNFYKTEVTFHVSSESKEKSESIKEAYEGIIRGGGLAQYVADHTGLSSAEVSEAVFLQDMKDDLNSDSITYVEDGKNVTLEILNSKKDTVIYVKNSDNFTLEIIHYDEQICQEIAQEVIQFAEDKSREHTPALGEYEIVVLDQTLAEVFDPEIATYQRTFINEMLNMHDIIESRKEDFGDEEWLYYDVMTNGQITGLDSSGVIPDKPEAIVSRGVTVTPHVDMKYALLGIIAAAFFYAFYVFVLYIFNTKIYATDSLQRLYDIPQLGQIPFQRKKKKFLGIVDDWIVSFRNRNKRKFSREEAVRLAAVAVKMSAERESLNCVYLIGCDMKEQVMEVCGQLKENLGRDNLQVKILNNVLYDAQAMSELENAQSVVLIEKAGSTLYTEIEQEVELLKRQEIKIFGGIVVE